MRKSNCRHIKIRIKITAYLAAASILLGHSMVGMATETEEPTESSETTEESVKEETPTQIENLETAQEDLQGITEKKSILAVVYLCNKYEVKDAPSKDGTAVVSVACGQSVQIDSVDLDEEGNVWYKVTLYQNEKSYTGYIEEKYLVTSDEVFLEWTDEHVEEDTDDSQADKPMTMSLPIMTLSNYPDVNQFPASYQNSLLALKQKYPNWIFVKMETGLNFNTAVSNELGDKSWISSTKPASWQNGAAAQSGWSYASEGILRYYMDPRNFLTESSIFQFEQLTYNESYHTENAVQAIVANSFMAGDIPNENMTYARAFTKIGEELKISPFHLASRVLQEQGTKGTSPLISGTYNGYEGYYNYFNVGASGKDIELIVKGLTEAMNRGWNTRYKSLYGGASVIGKNYILRGQDTLYLQKFNVSSNSTYNHQYMQNIQAPASEAPGIQKAYSNAGSLNNSFVFKIPVYSNMPASACAQPDTTDKITLSKSAISDLAVDKTERLVPYVNGSEPDNVNDMTFTSSNIGVATVDAQGVVKAVSPGTAKITCTRSGASAATCTVTVVKAEPIVDTPVLPPVVYKEGLRLAEISLPEGWVWSDGNTLLKAGTDSYPAVYTPADTTRYLTVTKQVGIKVSQAIPGCTVPENLTAMLGSKLGSIALPEGFIWESDAETILDKAGEQTFYLSYYPSDQNYFELLHIPVIVKVTGDSAEPEEPDDQDGTLPGGDGENGSSGSNSGSTTSDSPNNSSPAGSDNPGSSASEGNGTQNTVGTTNSRSKSNSGSTANNGSAGSNSGNGQSNNIVANSGGKDNGNTDSSASIDSGSANTDNGNTDSSASIDSGSANASNGSTGSSSPADRNDNNTANDGSNKNTNNGSAAINNNNNIKITGTIAQNRGSDDGASAGNNRDTVSALDNSVTEEDRGTPAYARPSVTVDMEDVSILTGEMLQMAKDRNSDLILTINNKAMWHVKADTVKGNLTDTDMNVLFERGVIPQDLLEQFGEGNEYREFTLAHDGPFGFGAELEISLNSEYCGRYANLFYYDSGACVLEFVCAEIIDENGHVRFSMEHASSYAIIISDHILTEIPVEDAASSSLLRWAVAGILILIALAAIGRAGYFYLQKRHEDEESCDEEDVSEENDDTGRSEESVAMLTDSKGKNDIATVNAEDDWIEDEDWQEPEEPKREDVYADDHAEDDWIEDGEWDMSNDWIDDEEWEKRKSVKKTAV